MGSLQWVVLVDFFFFLSAPSAPKDVLEALEQRRAKYTEASAQAKASGDDRKARMHDRIAKVTGETSEVCPYSQSALLLKLCHIRPL